MKTLCYMYVFNYKCLQNVDFVFDTRYKYHYNLENNSIDIQLNENDIPNNFWGENITSLTAIVGNNGAGKSTCLKLLLEELTSGYNKLDKNDVLILLRDDSRFFYCTSRNELNFTGSTTQADRMKRFEIPLFFFSSTSQLEDPDEITCSEYKGLSNATDHSLLHHDYKHYACIETSILSRSLREHISIHSYKETNRYFDIFLNRRLVYELDSIGLNLPKYVVFKHNIAGTLFYQFEFNNQKRIKKDFDVKNESIICDTNIYNQHKCSRINITKAHYIHYSLVNMLNNQTEIKDLPEYQYLKLWKEYVEIHKISGNCYDVFEQLITEQFGEIYGPIKETISILRELDRIAEYDEVSQVYYMSLSNDNLEILKDLNERCIQLQFLTGRVFDTFFQHKAPPSSEIHFSEGEKSILKFISRLYYFLYVLPKKYVNRDIAQLILLDEAEIGLHPEWQRNYINLIINSINKIGDIISKKFQVILSTHSPIILSDIPQGCTNYLKIGENGTSYKKVNQIETFATNVFQLYRNSFFMEDGLVGEFARLKINNLLERIHKKEIIDINKEIDMIGDERIKGYLINEMSKSDKVSAIRYYEAQIKKLKDE